MQVQEAFWDYFWLAKFFLRAAGILPFGGTPSPWKSILSKFLAASPLMYGLYVVIPEMNYILFKDHTIDDLLEAMTVTITVLGGQFRSIFIAVHRRKIARLFDICGTFWDHAIPADYKVISIWGRRARLFSTTYFCAAQLSITTFVLAASVKQLSLAQNSTIRYYPYGFEEDFIPGSQYEIKYTLQVICGHLGMLFVSAADMAGTLLALNLCGQFALVRSWLLDIPKEKFNPRNRDTNDPFEAALKKCIRRHQAVMDHCDELEEVVRYINLTQILTGMYTLSISTASLMKNVTSYRYYGPLLMSISGLFFSCWPADNLVFASTEVTEAVYGLPWYHRSSREKMAVAIMITRSQRPAKLTAGKFVALSLETFSSIVSSSLSFCMVLCTF